MGDIARLHSIDRCPFCARQWGKAIYRSLQGKRVVQEQSCEHCLSPRRSLPDPEDAPLVDSFTSAVRCKAEASASDDLSKTVQTILAQCRATASLRLCGACSSIPCAAPLLGLQL
jgi:hypothetical protein